MEYQTLYNPEVLVRLHSLLQATALCSFCLDLTLTGGALCSSVSVTLLTTDHEDSRARVRSDLDQVVCSAPQTFPYGLQDMNKRAAV